MTDTDQMLQSKIDEALLILAKKNVSHQAAVEGAGEITDQAKPSALPANLAAEPPRSQRRILLDKLKVEVAKFQPLLVERIVLTLTEQDNTELLATMASESALKKKINETMVEMDRRARQPAQTPALTLKQQEAAQAMQHDAEEDAARKQQALQQEIDETLEKEERLKQVRKEKAIQAAEERAAKEHEEQTKFQAKSRAALGVAFQAGTHRCAGIEPRVVAGVEKPEPDGRPEPARRVGADQERDRSPRRSASAAPTDGDAEPTAAPG